MRKTSYIQGVGKSLVDKLKDTRAQSNVVIAVILMTVLVGVGAMVVFTTISSFPQSSDQIDVEDITVPSAVEHNHTVVNPSTDEVFNVTHTPLKTVLGIAGYNNSSKAWFTIGLEAANYSVSGNEVTIKAAAMDANTTYINVTYTYTTDEIVTLSRYPNNILSVKEWNGTAWVTIASSNYSVRGKIVTVNSSAIENSGTTNGTTTEIKVTYDLPGRGVFDNINTQGTSIFTLMMVMVLVIAASGIIYIIWSSFRGGGGGGGIAPPTMPRM